MAFMVPSTPAWRIRSSCACAPTCATLTSLSCLLINMKKSILVVGSLNMDLVVQAARHPQPGEALWGTAFHTSPGGKGANQAIAAARLGAKVDLLGRVGADAFGEALLAALAA